MTTSNISVLNISTKQKRKHYEFDWNSIFLFLYYKVNIFKLKSQIFRKKTFKINALTKQKRVHDLTFDQEKKTIAKAKLTISSAQNGKPIHTEKN